MSAKNEPQPKTKRPFISVYWKCCRAFSRVHRNANSTAYEGQCPKCKAKLHVPVGKQGTTQRSFIAQ